MRYEVEMKFPRGRSMASLESRLVELGATISVAQTEVDVYFAHPARDFARTDEALRIRRKGAAQFPHLQGSQDRCDHENPPRDRPAAAARRGGGPGVDRALDALGFTVAGEVRKSRRKAHVVWQGRNVEASLDEVEGLGQFRRTGIGCRAGRRRGGQDVHCVVGRGVGTGRERATELFGAIAEQVRLVRTRKRPATAVFEVALALLSPAQIPRKTESWA